MRTFPPSHSVVVVVVVVVVVAVVIVVAVAVVVVVVVAVTEVTQQAFVSKLPKRPCNIATLIVNYTK